MNLELFYKELLEVKSPWEVSKVELDKKVQSIKIHLSHGSNSKFFCPSCKNLCSVYDHEKERTWRHLDTCQYPTYVVASLPRLNCSCGIKSVLPSWSRKHSRFTLLFECHAIDVLQQTQVISRSALLLQISESQLRTIRSSAVIRGLSRRTTGDYILVHLCIDEKSLKRGHHYITVLYNGTTGSVLEVVEHRTEVAAKEAFKSLGTSVDLSQIQVVTMDMWVAFKNASKEYVPQADIVHDRFHLAQYLNKAVDITRRAENKKLRKLKDERLKNSRYIWLKNEKNLTENQAILREQLIGEEDLETVKVWKLKENFKQFFDAKNQEEATSFFNNWSQQVIALKNKSLIKVRNTFQNHWEQLITYVKHKVSNAMAESINTSIQLLKAKAKGFNSAKAFRQNILFHLGKLDLYP